MISSFERILFSGWNLSLNRARGRSYIYERCKYWDLIGSIKGNKTQADIAFSVELSTFRGLLLKS